MKRSFVILALGSLATACTVTVNKERFSERAHGSVTDAG